jgi:hypothetical protein
MTVRAQLQKEKNSGHEPQESVHQDELIGGKPAVVKYRVAHEMIKYLI